jgi:hypothetical protein
MECGENRRFSDRAASADTLFRSPRTRPHCVIPRPATLFVDGAEGSAFAFYVLEVLLLSILNVFLGALGGEIGALLFEFRMAGETALSLAQRLCALCAAL